MRVLLPGTFYHIYNYAIEDENLFMEDSQYLYFLKKYTSHLHPLIKTYAYCLMPNHYHLLIKIRTEEELRKSLSHSDINTDFSVLVHQQFSNLLNSYTKAFNRHYNRKGTLFHSTIKNKAIEDKKELPGIVHYIHQNPVHHQYCQSQQDWYWSSYHTYMNNKKTLLQKKETIQWFGGEEGFKVAHSKHHKWSLQHC